MILTGRYEAKHNIQNKVSRNKKFSVENAWNYLDGFLSLSL